MTDLFTIRDLSQAADALAQIETRANRRNAFIDALDYEALAPAEQARIEAQDFATGEAILFGHLYLTHLAQMEELGARLTLAHPRAA